MRNIYLVEHSLDYCKRIYELSSAPEVKDALGLPDGTIKDTEKFIISIMEEEKEGKTISRVILDENKHVIGITTLMFIDHEKESCHLGTWIGHHYWGKGYNLASKIEILRIAFFDIHLKYVFSGARKVNIRSQKAQEKLPFIRLHVQKDFPDVHRSLELKEKQACELHVFVRDDFIQLYKNNKKTEKTTTKM
ncbi:GNAT family N-acetyltransferase [Alkalihalobacillus sp. MEB130]|uniref:GNAT family N-acetyltransferase n=1 Tax=Alkalihalobacillus sp. MEB130 TaxID=2976704 RepID=UPI0028DE7DCD|nr:GNAT family N-acetyltransferase [Alkalihalobacillus sp. MEB130]MDT8861179.1 GNAT family N-acetyltransferase [Alkalihalobacillus sp. MEB130]